MSKTYSGHCSKCGEHVAESRSKHWFRCAACRAAHPKSKDAKPCTPEMAARIVALLLNGGGRSGCIVANLPEAGRRLARMRRLT